MELLNEFTSTGSKIFHHQEAMRMLKDGKGMPIVSHVMLTDICQHTCAFCSVATREGNVLNIGQISEYLGQLIPLGLKSVILSGGGNPLLYKCPDTGKKIDFVIQMIHNMGLEIGMITNGMPLTTWQHPISGDERVGWKNLDPWTMDLLTWVRISMSGLDHGEKRVYVPEIDRSKTTLGFSYVYHDIYYDPKDLNHGKVSSPVDLKSEMSIVEFGEDRLGWLKEEFLHYVRTYKPTYLRLLPNCLEVDKIAGRCDDLRKIADEVDPNIVFVQYKPPLAPKSCYLGYIHPVLNSDGYVYPCDSCVLNAAADHKFANPWRICHGSEVGKLYTEEVRSLVDSEKLCQGCFTKTNNLLIGVRDGSVDTTPSSEVPVHVNFV